jgi:flagellar hook-associated protein 1 FlgK
VGTFDGLQIGSTGLHAQRRGVEVAGQNIANVNTEGYTRQRVDITADSGPITPAIHSTWSGSGLGVRSVAIDRIRDAFIDTRVRDEAARGAELTTLAGAYTSIERIFDEPSDTGLSAVLGDFLSAWDDVANQPGDIGARTQVIERGVTLANDIGELAAALTSLRDATRTELEATIAQVNADAAQLASLQGTIMAARAAGANTAELLDQRDLLLERITTAVGGTVRYEDDGTATVFLGGTAVVRGDRAASLQVQVGADDRVTVAWSLDGRAVSTLGGEASGLAQVVNDVVPGYLGELDTLGRTVRDQVNAVHTSGYDLDGDAGIDFFVGDGSAIAVNPLLRDAPRLLAASGFAGGNLDGSKAQELAGLTGVDATYRELVVGLGVRSQAAERRAELQGGIVAQVRAEQEGASGVNLDEELSDLVRFQRAYEASARFITAVDQLLDTLINGTGRVGR